jgi:hypothetical protein
MPPSPRSPSSLKASSTRKRRRVRFRTSMRERYGFKFQTAIPSSLRGAKRRSNPDCVRGGGLDCFRLRSLSYGGHVASLAMTRTRVRIPAARKARALRQRSPSREMRGRREHRMHQSHPRQKHAKGTPQVRRKHRHSLRNGLRLIRALLGVPGLLATVAFAKRPGESLIPASGDQDHTTSPSAPASPVLRHGSVHRIPTPTSVKIASRPSDGIRTRGYNHEIPKNGS